ncbi:MAG: biliverdin-producing heme oxygenase [Proteobacteria bacterium]|nr:MAG: biliverdin-producing heme oxygenase [Pseudomonadota bacterium]
MFPGAPALGVRCPHMTLLEEIRSRTEPLHRELEAVLDIPFQVNTPAQYTALLAEFHALYGPWEAALSQYADQFAGLGIQLPARNRVPNLEKDLRQVGGEALLQSASPSAAQLNSFPEALGFLYVLEGSTLGGQVLVRLFRERLGLPSEALHFFNSHGPQVGKMWKEFCAGLQTFEATASAEENSAVVAGARMGFGVITDHFRNR